MYEQKLISVIVPCYCSSKTIRQLVEQTLEEFEQIEGYRCELILVNDGSPDHGETLKALVDLSEAYESVTAVDLARNFGQHNAQIAGLECGRGDYYLSIDDDLQTHPFQIRLLIAEMEKGYDAVYGYYPNKQHSGLRNLGSWLSHKSACILLHKPKNLHVSSFWLIRKFVRDEVVSSRMRKVLMQGLFLRTTSNITSIPVEHHKRMYGKSGYNLRQLLRLWSGILNYSLVPLQMLLVVGTVFYLAGLLLGLILIGYRWVHPLSGMDWAGLFLLLLHFTGINLIATGIIGTYLGRSFQNISGEHPFVIRKIYKKGDVSSDAQE